MTTVAAPAPTSPGRIRELQDPLNFYIYHPLAARLARLLQPTGISPNAVSVCSGGLICAAAYLYCAVGWPVGVLAGFACHLAWHVVDGADGDLARLTGNASPIGEFVDGAADYLGHIVLYIALAAILDDWIGGWAWVLASASGVSRIVQSNHVETQRRTFLWRVFGVPWLKTSQSSGRKPFSGRGLLSRGVARIAAGYVGLAALLSPYSSQIDALLAAADDNPARQAEMRRQVRQASLGSFRVQQPLGPNPRTIILGLSMIAGTPLWFFLIEALALNVVLIGSVIHNNTVERRLLATLRRDADRSPAQ